MRRTGKRACVCSLLGRVGELGLGRIGRSSGETERVSEC